MTPPNFATLSPEDRRLVEEILARFRSAWQERDPGASPPSVEEFVARAPDSYREALRHELLAAEAEFRASYRSAGDATTDPGTEDPNRTGAHEAAGSEPDRTTDHQGAGTFTLAGTPDVPGYEILGELGRGGMGVVYKARQIRAGRMVALKMMLSAQASESQRTRFRTEAEAVAKLQHPNVVQVFEVGEFDGKPFFSLEYVEGGTLSRKVSRDLLPPREAAQMMLLLCRAMQYAHERGIVHRDLKPANVLLTPDGSPKIADFGLARKLEESGITVEGSILGTPSYMAPEQARGEVEQVGPSADQYTLGAILYELLTGRPPFRGSTMLDTLEQVRNREPVAVRTLQPKAPRDLETIALKCLRKEPKRRYASVKELGDDLQRYLNGEAIKARPVSVYGRAWRWCLRNPTVASMLAVVMALLVTTTAVSTTAYFRVLAAKDQAERKEKLAQERLELNRQSIDRVANRMPEIAENMPFSGPSRRELAGLVVTMLDGAGPPRDADGVIIRRGLMAAQQRRGEALMLEGNYDEAEKALEAALKAAREDYEEATGERSKTTGNLASVYLKFAALAQRRGKIPDAGKHLDEAIRLQQESVDAPASAEIRPQDAKTTLADFYRYRAEIARFSRDFPLAMKNASVADDLMTGLLAPGASPAVLLEKQRRVAMLAALERGRAAYVLERPDEGADAFRRSVVLAQALVKDHPNKLQYRINLAVAAAELGDQYFYLSGNDPAEARKYYQLAVAETHVLATPSELVYFVDRGHALNYYRCGAAATRLGDQKAAQRYFQRCLELREWFLGILEEDPTLRELEASQKEVGEKLKLAREKKLEEAKTLETELDRLNKQLARLREGINVAKINVMLAKARCGKHEEAAVTAGNLLRICKAQKKLADPLRRWLVQAACGFALCGNAAGADQTLKQKYHDQAIEALTLAVAAGYRNEQTLAKDPDLDPIRDLPAFQALLKMVQSK